MSAGAEAARAASGRHHAPQAVLQGGRPAEGSIAPTVIIGNAGNNGNGKGGRKRGRKQFQGASSSSSGKGHSSGSQKGHQQGNTKGAGGGKNKGGKPVKQESQFKTPDGREKCFRYQRGRCNGCDRVHSCVYCNGPHPGRDCKMNRKGDAAGSRAGR